MRYLYNISERLRISYCYFLPFLDFAIKYLQLCEENGGLQGIKPPVYTNANILVFMRTLAVLPQGAKAVCHRLMARKDCPPIPIASEGLGGEKACSSQIRYTPNFSAFVA